MLNGRCQIARIRIGMILALTATVFTSASILVATALGTEEGQSAQDVAPHSHAVQVVGSQDSLSQTLSKVIDERIRARWIAKGLQPASPAGDAEFVRRVYLDLTSRIPTRQEFRQFAGDESPEKRALLIDRLMSSDEFVIHFSNQLNALLLGRTSFPAPTDWIDWLRNSLRAGKGWDHIGREVILARPASPRDQGASEFLIRRFSGSESLDEVTRDVTRLFLGVDMQCARCHIHPEIFEWDPASYWGIAAFFNRTYLVDIEGKKHVAERARGEATYTDVDTKESHTAVPQFMTGAVPPAQPEAPEESPERLEERKAKYADAKPGSPLLDNPHEYLVPPAENPNAPSQPIYSRRAAFVDLAIGEENAYFVRAIVNRVWAWLLGQGLVEPLDQLHAGNAATHPELLDALSEDFVNHGFDLRRLVHGIVNSQVYQLSSVRHASGSVPAPEEYVQARLKPLWAHQFAGAVLCAVGHFEGATREEFEAAHAERIGELTKRFDTGSDQFQHGLPLALYLANNPFFARLVTEGALMCRLSAVNDDEELIRTMFESVLTRAPDADEIATMRSFLSARQGRREQACEHMIWSLLTSSEFRFNH